MKEKIRSLERVIVQDSVRQKECYIFGHCNATEELSDLLLSENYYIEGILDNNVNKQGNTYRGIPIISPTILLNRPTANMLILIASRAYAAMVKQLNELGYEGRIEKVIDYNTFAEYSLSAETIERKVSRLESGTDILKRIKKVYDKKYLIICPYSALGDVYYAMSYLPYYLVKKAIKVYVVIVVGGACAKVAEIFGTTYIEKLSQQDMDELVQAVLFKQDEQAFIIHHDRPYTNHLIKSLYVKFIPFEELYRQGVFGLGQDTKAYVPVNLEQYDNLATIPQGKSVILAPYAKSVVGIPKDIWIKIVNHYKSKNYEVYTNVVGDELSIEGTLPLSVSISQIQSVVEHAGTFIGVRSGLCDVIKNAKCKKIALYSDCYYSDTRWNIADFFALDGWENIVVDERKY